MAYRRSLTTSSSKLLTRRFNPSFSYVIHEDDGKHRSSSEGSNQHGIDNFLQRSFSTNSIDTVSRFGAYGRDRSCHPFSLPSKMGFDYHRHMSTSTRESSDKTEILTDISGVFPDTTLGTVVPQPPDVNKVGIFPDIISETVVQQAPAVNEVAIAAADSFPPVQALQHLIDYVHSFTGCNWWASIAISTLLIRVATIPILINQLKAMTQISLMRPHLDKLRQEMQNEAKTNPDAFADGNKRVMLLFKKYGVSPFTPFKGFLIQGPVLISFFLGISNMAEKVPSFKYGGAYWFTDLSTPDSLYIFPCLTALSLLIMSECNMQEGLEGNPIAGTMKKFFRVFAFLTIPFTLAFPKAIFCYWITSNMFSLMYGTVIRRPEVKNYLNIPIIPPAPPSTTPQADLSLSTIYKRYKDVVEQQTSRPIVPYTDSPTDSAAESPADSAANPPADSLADSPADLPIDSPKVDSSRKISSSSLLSQRIRSLEKIVKARKKGKEL